jgi:drug/metabolite transporter (DMT)-like permease
MFNINNRWLTPLAFSNIYIIWGLTFIAIAYGLNGFPPFILSGFRFLAAGLLIFGYLRSKGETARVLSNWKKNAITGILILTGGTGLVGWGEQYISAAEAAIAIATGPFWFIAIDKKNWRKYFSDKWIPIGLLIGFIGLVLFLGGSITNHVQSSSNTLRIVAFVVLALSSVLWVIGSLYSKNNPARQSTFMNIAQQLISAGLASLLIALFTGEWNDFSSTNIPLSAWVGLIFLILFGSVIAYISYIWLLTVKDAAIVSTHTYINPVVTVVAGWLIANEVINGRQFTGLIVILVGVLLTNITRYFKLTNRNKMIIRRNIRALLKLIPIYKPVKQF